MVARCILSLMLKAGDDSRTLAPRSRHPAAEDTREFSAGLGVCVSTIGAFSRQIKREKHETGAAHALPCNLTWKTFSQLAEGKYQSLASGHRSHGG
jgi:hypothetical protein